MMSESGAEQAESQTAVRSAGEARSTSQRKQANTDSQKKAPQRAATQAQRKGSGTTSKKSTSASASAKSQSNGRSPAGEDAFHLPIEQAEALIDETGERLGRLSVEAGQRLRRWTARLREDAEDMWAEARNLRDGTKSR